MCSGPLFGKILRFSLPLMFSGILQLLFNAADIVVVGRFAGKESLAAVGATAALINLLVNLFIGLSVGVNVLVANYFGAGRTAEMKETIHTAILTALLSGVFLVAVGVGFSKTLLVWMGTPEDVLDHAALYMRIYFVGMPVNLIYNFGSAVLRAIGDTKHPLYFLSLAGVINVILNLIFVIVFGMGVAGVAVATVISQCISAVLILVCLSREDERYALNRRDLRIYTDKLKRMAWIGLPAGIQSSLFSLSNVLIQSSINSFGSIVMAGSTAASNVEGFVYISMNTFQQAAMTFVSQNYGAKKKDRIRRSGLICVGMVVAVGLIMGNGAYLLGRPLLSIYSSDAEVISYGLVRMSIICTLYFICGMMDVMVGWLRGLGCSIMPMLVSLAGACGLRIVWLWTIFAQNRTLEVLFWSYPVTWLITFSVHVICYFAIRKKRMAHMA